SKTTSLRIDLPEGFAYFAGSGSDNRVGISRYVHLLGRGGGSANINVDASGFELAPFAYLSIDSESSSDDGGAADYSQLEHLHIKKKSLIVSDIVGAVLYNLLCAALDFRQASTFVRKGTVVVYSGTTVTGTGISKTDITLGGQSRSEY